MVDVIIVMTIYNCTCKFRCGSRRMMRRHLETTTGHAVASINKEQCVSLTEAKGHLRDHYAAIERHKEEKKIKLNEEKCVEIKTIECSAVQLNGKKCTKGIFSNGLCKRHYNCLVHKK